MKRICSALLAIIVLFTMGSSAFAKNSNELKPSNEQIQKEREKARIAEEYVLDNYGDGSDSVGDVSIKWAVSRINPVGTYIQQYSYSCGAAAARNLIYGYVQAQGGAVPSEATLRSSLHTSTAGTDFNATYWENTLDTYAPGNSYSLKWGCSNWEYNLRYRVLYTIDQGWNWPYYPYTYFTDGYNVIGDLNYTTSQVTDAMPGYENSTSVAHYICIYGYNDSTDYFNISDSNPNVSRTYIASFSCVAEATYNRGIIW